MEGKEGDKQEAALTSGDRLKHAPALASSEATILSQSQHDSSTAPDSTDRPHGFTGSHSIEVDSQLNAGGDAALTDDGYETDGASRASTSICSNLRDYEFENNRRFHKYQEGRYQFPNDEPEQEREDMKHVMIVNLCGGKLHFAPLQNPQHILDVGTGTGIWAVDMGDEYPSADIQGIDLSPIQPQWVPPNVRFILDDAEAEWLYPPGSLDYIHIRHLTSTIRDWPLLLSRAYEALEPGGWIELQELKFEFGCDDGTMRQGNLVAGFFENMSKGLATFGIDLLAMRHNKQHLIDAGFTNVTELTFKVPFGVWPKDSHMKKIGLYNRNVVHDALSGVSMKPFTHGLNWTTEQIEVYLVDVRKECMDSSQHVYLPFCAVMGQKPL